MESNLWWEQTEFGISSVCNLGFYPMSMYLNPIYLTARQILEHPACPESGDLFDVIDYSESILFKYYKFVSSNKKKHVFCDLSEDLYRFSGSKTFLNKMHPDQTIVTGISWERCYAPWYQGPIAPVKPKIKEIINKPESECPFSSEYYLKNAFSQRPDGKSGWKRLLTTLRSIREAGYNFKTPDPSDSKKIHRGFVTCHRLVDEDKERIFITQGNHRVAIFFALYPDKKIPCLYDHKRFYRKKRILSYYSYFPKLAKENLEFYEKNPILIGVKNHYKRKDLEGIYIDHKIHWKSLTKKKYKNFLKSRKLLSKEKTLSIFDSYLNVSKEVETEWKDFLRQSGFERFL